LHEGLITKLILAKALEKAAEADAKRIKKICIVFGDMWGVVDHFVESYFNFLSKETIAEGASLSFQRTPIKLRCRNCDHIYMPESLDWSCPNCRVKKMEILSGRECHIVNMEVE
jgi:hydrogenase nickel incorporation protein HypA/HybF